MAKFEGEKYVLKKLKMNNIVGLIEGRKQPPMQHEWHAPWDDLTLILLDGGASRWCQGLAWKESRQLLANQQDMSQ